MESTQKLEINEDAALTSVRAEWLMKQWEDSSDRYMEAEKFILDLKWYHLLFTNIRLRFLKSRDKYSF